MGQRRNLPRLADYLACLSDNLAAEIKDKYNVGITHSAAYVLKRTSMMGYVISTKNFAFCFFFLLFFLLFVLSTALKVCNFITQFRNLIVLLTCMVHKKREQKKTETCQKGTKK